MFYIYINTIITLYNTLALSDLTTYTYSLCDLRPRCPEAELLRGHNGGPHEDLGLRPQMHEGRRVGAPWQHHQRGDADVQEAHAGGPDAEVEVRALAHALQPKSDDAAMKR